MVINGKLFPVHLVADRPGYWIKFGSWSDDKSWDLVSEEDMVRVANWCDEHGCGKRMSYDMFKFRTEQELQFFMLKWA